MIIINLKGGLGNQMFQYALGYCLSKKKNTELYLDTRLMEEHKIKPPPRNVPRDFDLDIFDIEKKIVKKIDLIKTLQFSNSYRVRQIIAMNLDKLNLFCFYEKKRIFNKRVFLNNFKNIYLDGLWQSEKYFIDYRKDILNLFSFDKIKNLQENITLLNKINFDKSVCLNVRRTDFLTNPEHNVVNIDYYKKALEILKKKFSKDLDVYIFSDDLEWCKENFQFLENKHFIEHQYAGNKFFNYLYLMTCFKIFVIPNSSFAWWAAWLSKKNDKVILVPEKWSGLVNQDFIDIIPENWIKVKF